MGRDYIYLALGPFRRASWRGQIYLEADFTLEGGC